MGKGKKLVESWIETLEGYEPNEVVKMYYNKGILLGTLAPKPLVGREEIKTYFDKFLKLNPTGAIMWCYTQRMGFNKIVVDGNYTFEIDNKKARKEVDARFTFVFRRNWLRFGRWEILTHHSSERPKKTKVI